MLNSFCLIHLKLELFVIVSLKSMFASVEEKNGVVGLGSTPQLDSR